MIFHQVIIVLGTLSFACGSPMACIRSRQDSLRKCVTDQGLQLNSRPIQHGQNKFCRQRGQYAAAIECAIDVIQECVPQKYWPYTPSRHQIQKMSDYLCSILYDVNKACFKSKALDLLHCMGNRSPDDKDAMDLCSFLERGAVCLKNEMYDCGCKTGNFFVNLTKVIYPSVCPAVDINPKVCNAGNGPENRAGSKDGDPDNTRDNNGDSKDGDPDNTRDNNGDSKDGDPDNTRDNNGDSKDGDPDNTRDNNGDSKDGDPDNTRDNNGDSKDGDPDNTRDNNGDSKDGDPDNTRDNNGDANQDTGGSKGTATQSAASSAGLLTATSAFLAYCHIFM